MPLADCTWQWWYLHAIPFLKILLEVCLDLILGLKTHDMPVGSNNDGIISCSLSGEVAIKEPPS
jgi:hypothetical protein